MPRISGCEALLKIHRDLILKEVPVIVWTTSSMPLPSIASGIKALKREVFHVERICQI
jgi:CheY-like chemotaxis protein